ncbi:efflux RND transporter periplasmic adaptor subunit [Lentilitoribacter sp. EG35]|uniref:efflux RND transporter periplasmic adaptor subunit n=1 Tax=Lentilitoribacter sp. EG35 TaxID=3234192 RepID=UPI0034616235
MLDKPISETVETKPALDEPIQDVTKARRSPFMVATRAIIQFILMGAVLFGSYFAMERLISGREEPGKRPFTRQALTVETRNVTIQDHRPTVLVYGEVETAAKIDMRPLVGGEIIDVNPNLSAGVRINKGDLLVEIDRFNYEGAVLEAKANLTQVEGAIREIEARLASEKDQLKSSNEQLNLARADLTRAQSLSQSGTLTKKQVDDRMLIVSQREQSVGLRRNNIIIAEAQREQQLANTERLKWKLREAERKLENTKLFAPFGGIISNSDAEIGRSVSSNDIIASIYDDKSLEVRFTLTNAQYGRMAIDSDQLIGRKVAIDWTIGETNYEYSGTINRIGATVAADRGGVEVVARIDPVSHAVQLRPGAFVEIVVPDKLYSSSINVPETSIYDQSYVFVVKDDKLARRDIEILAFDGSNAIVSSKKGGEQINDGDQLLITRLTEANDGIPVQAPGKGRFSDGNKKQTSNKKKHDGDERLPRKKATANGTDS